jgi:hypothetical protein
VPLVVYLAKVPLMVQVVSRTATSKREAALIIRFFFIKGFLLSEWAFTRFFYFLPFPGRLFLPGIPWGNDPSAENAAAFIIIPGTWLPKEEYNKA